MAGKNVSADFFDTSVESTPVDTLSKSAKKRIRKLKRQEEEAKLQLNMSVSEDENEVNDNNDEDEDATGCNDKVNDAETKTQIKTCISLEKSLDEINSKLNNVLTKNDNHFIKQIIKDTVNELKESLLESVVKRIEIVEGELHDKVIENDALKKEVNKLSNTLKDKQNEIKQMKTDQLKENARVNKILNDQEQYSRKNNLRITSIKNDHKDESSLESTHKTIKLLNDKLQMNLSPQDIDISHRLGPFKTGQNRPVIVKFVHRQVKQDILRARRNMKNSGSTIYEDMSRLNSEILAATRKKLPDLVEQSWFSNGSVFVKWKNESKVVKLEYKDFQYWIDLDWPEGSRTNRG